MHTCRQPTPSSAGLYNTRHPAPHWPACILSCLTNIVDSQYNCTANSALESNLPKGAVMSVGFLGWFWVSSSPPATQMTTAATATAAPTCWMCQQMANLLLVAGRYAEGVAPFLHNKTQPARECSWAARVVQAATCLWGTLPSVTDRGLQLSHN